MTLNEAKAVLESGRYTGARFRLAKAGQELTAFTIRYHSGRFGAVIRPEGGTGEMRALYRGTSMRRAMGMLELELESLVADGWTVRFGVIR